VFDIVLGYSFLLLINLNLSVSCIGSVE
jgi:hypothetical protein